MTILGIDIGGTKTICGISDESGNIISWKRIDTPGYIGPDKAIGMIKECAWNVIKEADAKVDVIGIGCGGPMDRKAGILHDVPNLPGWKGLCLTEIFAKEFDAPSYLDNDATCACIGEFMFGAGKGVNDMVYFTISTGIGGGIIADGRVYRGYGDNAGEFGHMKILINEPDCPCGDKGCLEALCSGTSIAKRIKKLIKETNPETILLSYVDDVDKITAEHVSKAASEKDPFASSFWQETMEYLGIGISNVVNILNPRLVVLGGGVTRAGNMLFNPVRDVVNKRAMAPLAADCEIVPAANGDLTGLLGAVALAVEQTNS
ncbi:MAG: ROK family protein [Armatimonadota bacterium]